MNWQTESWPDRADFYTVSVKKEIARGHDVFIARAYFDLEHHRWSEYDPFRKKLGEDITSDVIAWHDLPVFVK